MSEQPEALYLADELEKLLILGDLGPNGNTAKTIRQLRRLHALCEESRTAVLGLLNALPSTPAVIAARTLVAKLENEQ